MAVPLWHQRPRLLFFNVISYSKMAAGVPFIRSIFQANSYRKGKKRKWVPVSHFYIDFPEDPFNYVSLTIILSYGHI